MCWVGVADIDLPIYPNYTTVRTCTITLYGGVLVWLYVVFVMILAQCLTSFSVKQKVLGLRGYALKLKLTST